MTTPEEWMEGYNYQRLNGGKYCFGKSPMKTFTDIIEIAEEEILGYELTVK